MTKADEALKLYRLNKTEETAILLTECLTPIARVVCGKYLKYPDIGEDIINDGLAQVLCGDVDVVESTSITTWFATVIRNKCLDKLKYIRREIFMKQNIDATDVVKNPEAGYQAKIVFEQIKKCLTPTEIKFLEAKLEGLSITELQNVSDLTNVSREWLNLKKKIRKLI